MRYFLLISLLVVAFDHLHGKVSQLCLEGTTFETSLRDSREKCGPAGGIRPQGGFRPHLGKPPQGRHEVENLRVGPYSKCKPAQKVAERWETLFAEENCILVEMGLRLNSTSPLNLEKYELVTDSIDSSLAALIHPNSTMMRRCIDKTTSALTQKLIKCWGGYTDEEHSLLVKFAVGSAIANCFTVTLNQGCIGWLGVKLGRGEVGMREFSLQEIEEQLFDKEMSIEEDMLDY